MVNDNDQSARKSSIASGWTVEGQPELLPREELPAGVLGDPRPEGEANPLSSEISSGALVLFGLLGGLYLLFTFVWFSWANAAAQVVAATSGENAWSTLQQTILWIGPAAPALWFVTVLLLCRGAKVRRIVFWLLIGAVLLVPLPMFGGLF